MIFRHLKNKISFIGFFTLYLFVFNISLYGMNFDKCKAFYINNSKEFDNIRAFHIGNGKYLAYSKTIPKSKSLIKKDEILNLYIFKDEILKAKFDLTNLVDSNTPIAGINKNEIIKGKIISKQESFNNFAKFDKDLNPNSIISDICYQIYGLSIGGNSFIDEKYINKFLESKNPQYSYIGALVKDVKYNKKNEVIVYEVNPLANNSLKIGDNIISINNKKIKNANDFIDTIAQIKPNSSIKINIERENNIFDISLKTLKRNTPFEDNPSFLESIGIILNDNLIILKNENNNNFKANDKILKINQIKVNSIKELNDAIIETLKINNKLSFLIVRNNFEFFIDFMKINNDN